MQPTDKIISVIGLLSRWLAYIAAVSVMVMMFAVCADIAGLKLFNHPVHGAVELTELLMIIVVYLGLTYTYTIGGHATVGSIVGFLPRSAREPVNLFASAIVVFVAILLTLTTGKVALYSIQTGEYVAGGTDFPLAPSRISIFLGCLFFSAYSVMDLLKRLLLAFTKDREKGAVT